MAAMTTTPWLNGIGLILLFTINYALSDQHSGILSNLYKKAAQQNRPMILVIDNSQDSNAVKNRDLSSKSLLNFVLKKTPSLTGGKKHTALDSHTDRDVQNNWPYNLNKHLGHQHYRNRDQQIKAKVHDHGLTKSRLRSRNHDRHRLQSQLDKDDRNYHDSQEDRNYWDNREDRDRRNRYRDNRDRRDRDKNGRDRRDPVKDERDRRDRDKFDLNRDDQDRRDRNYQDRVYKDRNDLDRRDRDRDDRDRRDQDREYRDRRDRDRDDRERRDRYRTNRDRRDRYRYDRDRRDQDRYNRDRYDYDRYEDRTLRLLEKSNKDKQEPQIKDAQKDSILQPSVIKNLLRITNDLNCEAQDECQNKCEAKYSGKKKDNCENKCEYKFECDASKENSCNGKNCSLENECDESSGCDEEDKNPSTKGMIFDHAPSLCPGC